MVQYGDKLKESISLLESEIKDAEGELENALIQQRRVNALVEQWQTELSSLQKLLEVRRIRLAPEEADLKAPVNGNWHNPGILVISNGTQSGSMSSGAEVAGHDPGEQTKVGWIVNQIGLAGTQGRTAAEIYKLADKAGVTMHPNYPYTVLKSLAKRGRILKQGTRYFQN